MQYHAPGCALVLIFGLLAPQAASSAEAPTQLFWGDTHVHTSWSGDAYALGTRLSHDDAYRFAKGEAVRGSGGLTAQLDAPLDFLMIADHAENMGVVPLVAAGDKAVPDSAEKRRWQDFFASLPPVADVVGAADVDTFNAGNQSLGAAKAAWQADYGVPESLRGSLWGQAVQFAEQHNEPGRFTTFIGYEWTGRDAGRGIHRNVLFRDGPGKAGATLPFSRFDSDDPEDLWEHLRRYEQATGGRVISIPHNSNLSGGRMFSRYQGGTPTEAYARRRAYFEPLVEITQIKGDSESHAELSPRDPFAGFESWDFGAASAGKGKGKGNAADPARRASLQQSHVRPALQLGLRESERLGVNPFRFGVIGSTDSHTALATADERAFWGKMGLNEPGPYRAFSQSVFSASGYAAVWATSNTRAALFDAMRRGEVYATTGPRMRVRVFGGWSFGGKQVPADFVTEGYKRGVPMGGDLGVARGDAPGFIVRAGKDPAGANLDRVQIVKGWLDEAGGLREEVFDIALADGRMPTRALQPAGKADVDVPAPGSNGAGDAALSAVWVDPEFDPARPAFYYVRVLEIPTPRWTAWDARRFGLELPANVPVVVQDRAYTSPIWYTPPG